MAVTGLRIGRYEFLEQIGAGGMGDVYRAHDHDLQRDVAVKFLPERYASDPSRLSRFSQEARTASSLNHPNIVTIHEIGQIDGRPYIVMEHVDGETLRRIIQRGEVTARQTLDIGIQLAEGLAKAHSARIVHRDLKPENVMVTKDGFVKILDFGLAKLRGGDDHEAGGHPARKAVADAKTDVSPSTAVGVLVGTAGYMSPEQARGQPADHRSDQFALGAILYEMATARRAFHRDSVVQTLSAIIDTQPQPIESINPSFPAPARWVIERCLAKDPDERYASTQDLAQELRGVRERLSESSSPALTGLSQRLRAPRASRPVAALGLVLAILFLTPIGGGLVRLIRPAPPLSGEVRLAVMVDDAGLPAESRERLTGLLDYLVVRLADLNRFHETLSVVPASELREAHVRTGGEAKRRVGANRAVNVSVHQLDGDLVVSVSVEDTDRVRVLGGDQRRFRPGEFSEEDVVELIGRVLRLELPAVERTLWTAGSSGVAEARTMFARGLVRTPYQTAQTALERYDQEQSLQQAIEEFNRAIALDPRYADAYARLGESLLWLYRLTNREDHITLAEQNAVRARELDDTRPSTWITLGMIRAQKGEYAAAEEAFGQAIVRGPRSSIAYRELARMQQRAGEADKAEANYRKAIELDPESWSGYSHLGAFLAASSRLDEAEQMFVQATQKAPDNARAWANLGALYYLQQRFDEAEQALERGIELYDYGPALSNLATIKFRVRRNYAEAASLLERAADAAPRDYRILLNLAAPYYWMPGQRARAAEPLARAIEVLEEAGRVEPDNADVLASLAVAHAMRREPDVAQPLAARAVELAPANGVVASMAADVYETLGDRGAALRQVQRALAAGVEPFEFETNPTFAALVKDSRYAAMISER